MTLSVTYYNPRECLPRFIVNCNYVSPSILFHLIIIDVRLVIFFGSMWIVLGSNNSNDNAVLLLLYRHATTSHRHGIIMYGLLWPTFVDKKREGTVSHQC